MRPLAPHRPLAPERHSRPNAERGNRLLEAVSASPESWAALQPHLEFVRLEADTVVERPGPAAEHVYFPINGLCAVYAHGHGQKIEIAQIGNEGVLCASGLLGSNDAVNESVVQLAVEAWWIKTETLSELLGQQADLRRALLHYVKSFIAQIVLHWTS